MDETLRIELNTTHRLAISRPAGCLDAALADALLFFIMALEDSEPEPFHRLLDLTRLREIRLNGAELCDVAHARRTATADRPLVRTAILATSPFAYSVAKLYEDLMEGSSIRVRVFRNAPDAAEWLGISPAIVETVEKT